MPNKFHNSTTEVSNADPSLTRHDSGVGLNFDDNIGSEKPVVRIGSGKYSAFKSFIPEERATSRVRSVLADGDNSELAKINYVRVGSSRDKFSRRFITLEAMGPSLIRAGKKDARNFIIKLVNNSKHYHSLLIQEKKFDEAEKLKRLKEYYDQYGLSVDWKTLKIASSIAVSLPEGHRPPATSCSVLFEDEGEYKAGEKEAKQLIASLVEDQAKVSEGLSDKASKGLQSLVNKYSKETQIDTTQDSFFEDLKKATYVVQGLDSSWNSKLSDPLSAYFQTCFKQALSHDSKYAKHGIELINGLVSNGELYMKSLKAGGTKFDATYKKMSSLYNKYDGKNEIAIDTPLLLSEFLSDIQDAVLVARNFSSAHRPRCVADYSETYLSKFYPGGDKAYDRDQHIDEYNLDVRYR